MKCKLLNLLLFYLFLCSFIHFFFFILLLKYNFSLKFFHPLHSVTFNTLWHLTATKQKNKFRKTFLFNQKWTLERHDVVFRFFAHLIEFVTNAKKWSIYEGWHLIVWTQKHCLLFRKTIELTFYYRLTFISGFFINLFNQS